MEDGTRIRVRYLMNGDHHFNAMPHIISHRRAGAEGVVIGKVSGKDILYHRYVQHDDEGKAGEVAVYDLQEMQVIETRYNREVLP